MENLLPLLVLLACPLMMIFMMKGMHGSGQRGHAEHRESPSRQDERDRRIIELEKQVADLRRDASEHTGVDGADRAR